MVEEAGLGGQARAQSAPLGLALAFPHHSSVMNPVNLTGFLAGCTSPATVETGSVPLNARTVTMQRAGIH